MMCFAYKVNVGLEKKLNMASFGCVTQVYHMISFFNGGRMLRLDEVIK